MNCRIITISPTALKRRVLSTVRPVGVEVVRIESSRGRILGESIRSPRPVPEMDRAAMDGYAVRHVDLKDGSPGHPVCLICVGNLPASTHVRCRLRRGETVRIMTGAPLPPGADSVVPVEKVRIEGTRVYFDRPVTKFKDMRRAGSEIRRHQMVLKQGQIIGASQMAMLALMDRPRVKVYRRPRVGVLSTGDELGPVGKKRPYGHIPDSNRYGLLGLIESAGCVPVDGGRVGDDPGALLAGLKKIQRRSDFIGTSGGVSAGDLDVVKVLFQRVGGVDLYRLPIKPGKPQAFGHVGEVPFFGLPGNPVSAMVVFDFLVRPALRKLAGAAEIELPRWRATVTEDFPRKTRGWEFPRAIAREQDGQWTVRPVASQKSANLKSMTDADGYLFLTPESPQPLRGTEVVFVPFPR